MVRAESDRFAHANPKEAINMIGSAPRRPVRALTDPRSTVSSLDRLFPDVRGLIAADMLVDLAEGSICPSAFQDKT